MKHFWLCIRLISIILVGSYAIKCSTAYSDEGGNAFCRGFCTTRYADGFEEDGKCSCVDFYPLDQKHIRLPYKRKAGHGVHTYDGVDKMHYPSYEEEFSPTSTLW